MTADPDEADQTGNGPGNTGEPVERSRQLSLYRRLSTAGMTAAWAGLALVGYGKMWRDAGTAPGFRDVAIVKVGIMSALAVFAVTIQLIRMGRPPRIPAFESPAFAQAAIEVWEAWQQRLAAFSVLLGATALPARVDLFLVGGAGRSSVVVRGSAECCGGDLGAWGIRGWSAVLARRGRLSHELGPVQS